MHAHMTMVQAGAESVQVVLPLLLSSLPLGSFADDDAPLCMHMTSHALP